MTVQKKRENRFYSLGFNDGRGGYSFSVLRHYSNEEREKDTNEVLDEKLKQYRLGFIEGFKVTKLKKLLTGK